MHSFIYGPPPPSPFMQFWNTANGSMLNSVDTGSQVSAANSSRRMSVQCEGGTQYSILYTRLEGVDTDRPLRCSVLTPCVRESTQGGTIQKGCRRSADVASHAFWVRFFGGCLFLAALVVAAVAAMCLRTARAPSRSKDRPI